MKRTALVFLSVLCASPLFADAGQHLIPAGSLIGCTLSEPRLSSKTTAIGDPVLCQVGHSERYGRSVLPYNSYLVGRFEDYRDPGHFVGKGWMELRFDRMVIEPDTVIPIDARVVDVPGYRVDNQGRILGKGHAVRDAVLWSIPILWPLDLVMLPMRGPRPVLKEEARLTLKVMDDLAVPATDAPQLDPYGLRHRSPDAYDAPPPGPAPNPEPAPETAYAPQPEPQPEPQPQLEAYAYAQPVAPPPVMVYAPMIVAPPSPVMAYVPMVISSPVAVYSYAPRMYAPAPRANGYAYGASAYGYAPRAYRYAAGPVRSQMSYGGGRPVIAARAGMAYSGYSR